MNSGTYIFASLCLTTGMPPLSYTVMLLLSLSIYIQTVSKPRLSLRRYSSHEFDSISSTSFSIAGTYVTVFIVILPMPSSYIKVCFSSSLTEPTHIPGLCNICSCSVSALYFSSIVFFMFLLFCMIDC